MITIEHYDIDECDLVCSTTIGLSPEKMIISFHCDVGQHYNGSYYIPIKFLSEMLDMCLSHVSTGFSEIDSYRKSCHYSLTMHSPPINNNIGLLLSFYNEDMDMVECITITYASFKQLCTLFVFAMRCTQYHTYLKPLWGFDE